MNQHGRQWIVKAGLVLLLWGHPLGVLSQEPSLKPQWVNGYGRVVAVTLTPERARRQAIQQARLNALEKLQVHLQAQSQQWIQETPRQGHQESYFELITTHVQARIIEEDTLRWRQGFIERGIPVYEVWLRIKAVPENGHRDPAFTITARLNRSTFRPGEEMRITLKTSRPGFVYLFNIFARDSVQLLFPNTLLPHHLVMPGLLWKFPPDSLSRWVGLQVQSSDQAPWDQQAVYIVVLRHPVPFTGGTPLKAASEAVPIVVAHLFDLNRWLLQIPLEARREVLLPYVVMPNSHDIK